MLVTAQVGALSRRIWIWLKAPALRTSGKRPLGAMASPADVRGPQSNPVDSDTIFSKQKDSVFDEATMRESLRREVEQALQAHGLNRIDEGSSKTDVIQSLARSSQKQRIDTEMWKRTAMRATALLMVALFANFGLVMWATDLQKDTSRRALAAAAASLSARPVGTRSRVSL